MNGSEPMRPSVEITARTGEGREVTFRHDEIRDYHDNIRLDYGYALTITSAQGLTVDRAYLLADDRPARETVYPAATRHRERLDIYVNRAPLAFAIAERRPEDQAERPIMDADIRAHLAERWSRSQPKEAALDYITYGAWRDQREKARHIGRDLQGRECVRTVDNPRTAANDNALARVAGEIRRTAFGWRHGQAVAAFADGRRQVLAAYDDLRERTRTEGDAVALGGAFRETLIRHGALLKQAETFRSRPADFTSLLAGHGGIGRKELDAFEELHARASHHRRAATMRHVHRIKREAEPAPTQRPVPELRVETAATPVPTHSRPTAGTDTAPARPDAGTLYEALQRDWNRLIERANEAGVPTFDMEGGAILVARMRSLTESPGLPDGTRQELAGMFENHQRHADARKHIEDWLSAGPEHMKEHEILGREAVGKDLGITETGTYPEWREKAGRLIVVGEAILSDAKTYGAHLDNLPIGNTPVEEELLRLQRAIRDDDNSSAKRKAREQRSEPVDRQDEAAKPVGTDTAPARPDVRTLYEAVQRDWNRLVERAREAGVPTFDMEGSEPLIERMRSLMENPELPARTRHAFAGAIQEYRQGELALEGSHVEEPGGAETVARDVAAAPSPDHAATPVESAVTPDAAVAPPADEDRAPSQVQEPAPSAAEPVWLPAYEALVQDWNALAASARQSGTLSFYLRGYADLISSLRVLAENPDIPAETRTPMIKALENHEINLSTRKKVENWLSAVERHKDRRDALEDAADNLDMPVSEAPEYPDWRREAERQTTMGKDILSDTETYGAHLANITRGELRMDWALSQLREAVREDDEELARRKARKQSEPVPYSAGLSFAVDDGADPKRADTPGVLSKLRHAVGRVAGGAGYYDRMRTEMYTRQVLEQWETLKRDWNRQVEQAGREGVHVIYTDRYNRLHEQMDTLSKNMLLDYDIGSQMRAVLSRLDEAVSDRRYAGTWRNLMAGQLDHREALEAEEARRGVAVPDHRDYDTWRNVTDKAADHCAELLARRERYGIHLDDIARRGESLPSALSRVRETLRDDDRHIAATLVQQRKGEDISMREERIARLLDDPEKLRDLRQKRAEQKAGKRQRKGRHMSMGMRM